MLRGYRGIIFALAGLALLSAAPSPGQSGKTNQHQSAATTQKPLDRIANAQAQQAESGEYQAPCRDGEYNYKSDLCAQWYAARAARDAADWAYWAVFWTVVSLGLSAVGLIALLITIKQGRLGLERAREANEIATKTAHDQLRAYVNVTSVKMIGFLVGNKPRLEIELTNGGQTPARGCTVQTFYHYCEGDPDAVKIPIRGSKRKSLMDIPPGKPSFGGAEFDDAVGAELYLKILSGQGTVIFAGFVSYRDIFGKRHLTLFRYFVIPSLINNEGTASLIASYRQNRSS